ncbi:MAG: hypothetical protein ABJA83_03115 [Burkholderiaceae bacterium]
MTSWKLRALARRWILACGLLMLFAQHGAWLHALSHWVPSAAASAPAVVSEQGAPADTCSLCLAFATFDGGAPAFSFAALLDLAPADIAPATPKVLQPRFARGYSSRAPPHFA